jgi:putative peptide zinc metalloprotease protein
MDPAASAGNLEGRKRVRVRLRPNLVFAERYEEGRTLAIIKDPLGLQYFRLEERQRFVVCLMDGVRTLDDIRRAFEQRFRPERLSLEELEGYVAQLLTSGLVQNEAPAAGRLVYERARRRGRDAWRSALLNFLAIRLPLCNPDRWFDRLLPWARFLFTVPALLLGLVLMLAALGLLATHWDDLLARLPDSSAFFGFPTLLYLWLAVGLVKILHELGHGLCCKTFGGSVPEMGILFLVFAPSLYCDTTDSWMVASKWQRIAVTLAGMYVELLVASLATFAWWLTDATAPLHHLCLAVMVVSGVQTVLFNANPLMRFDGYYALSDWLEVPNLADQADRLLHSRLLGGLGVKVPREVPVGPARPGVLVAYALASHVYRWAALAAILYLAHAFLEPYRLGSLVYVLGAAALAPLLGWPLVRSARGLWKRGRLPDMKPARTALAAGALLAAAAVVVVPPWPVTVEGTALIQVDPDQVQRVEVPEPGGFLSEILVRDSQPVRAGEVLAVLTNPQLAIALRVNEADQALRQEQKGAQLTELTDPRAPESQAAGSLQQTEFELRTLQRQHATLGEQQAQLTLRAPCDGLVLGLRPVEEKGTWLEEGAELCRVGNDRALRAVFLVEPADHVLVAPGSPAWVWVQGTGLRRLRAVVTEVAQVEAKQVPPQLSSRAGGEVPTRQEPAGKVDVPCMQHYLCSVRLQGGDDAVHPGAVGRVRVDAGSQTLWWRFRRYLATTFNWNF